MAVTFEEMPAETAVASPPKSGFPHATAEPFEVMAANAEEMGNSCPLPAIQIFPEAVVWLPKAPR